MTFSVFRVGEETRVNQFLTGDKQNPAITSLSDGWLVTWTSSGQDGGGQGIYMQKYNFQGQPQFLNGSVLEDRLVTAGHATNDPMWSKVTTLENDAGFVVTWVERSLDGLQKNVFQQRYNLSGEVQGPAQQVNGIQNVDDTWQNLSIDALPDGGWVTTWSAGDANGSGIYQQRFDSLGAGQFDEHDEMLVNTSEPGRQQLASVTVLDDGGWIVAWVSNPDQRGTPFDPGADIFMRRYDEFGVALGDEIQVNATTHSNQSRPQVKALPDGGWLVVWESDGQDGDNRGIFMQRYDRNGAVHSSTAEQLVNRTVEGSQTTPMVEVLADGGWVITWESGSTTYQRYYDAFGSTVGPDLPVRNTSNFTVFTKQAAIAATPDGGWIVTWLTQYTDEANNTVLQRTFTKTAQQILTTGQEYALGTDDRETLLVQAGGLSFGDVVDGGLGIDTLQIVEAGSLDIYSNYVRGIEVIRGSADDDTIVTDSTQLAPLMTIDGGGGNDELIFFDGDQIYDLRGKSISGIERIVLADFQSPLIVDNAATALLAHGEGGDNVVRLVGSAFTLDQRLQLFRQGIEEVVDAAGTWTNALPEIGNLNGDQVVLSVNSSARLDVGNRVAVTEDTGHFLSLTLAITNGVWSQDRLRLLETARLSIDGETISFDGTEIGTIVSDGSNPIGLVIDFSASANPAAVAEVINAVSFVHSAADGAAVTKTRNVSITLVDGGGAQNEVGVTVEVVGKGGTNTNTAPTIALGPAVPPGYDNALLSPFANAVVNDREGQTLTVTIKLDDKNKGILIPLANHGQYDAETGTFTIIGSAGRVTDALNGLQFNPRDRNGPVGTPETTKFEIRVDDGITVTSAEVTVRADVANRAPNVSFTSNKVSELASNGTVAGTLSATDPNGSEGTLTYSLLGSESAPFELVKGTQGMELRVRNGVVLDYEQDREHVFTVRVTDTGGLSVDRLVSINLSDLSPENTAGSAANDKFIGGAGRDTLSGAAGDDTLSGALGNDTLKGEAGKDIFVFSTRANTKTNKDKLVDFSVKDDAIWLDNAAFIKLGKQGTEDKPIQLSKSFFTIGSKAKDKNDYIVYDSKKGVLYYDADGSGKGGAVEITTLSKNLKMTNKDFFII